MPKSAKQASLYLDRLAMLDQLNAEQSQNQSGEGAAEKISQYRSNIVSELSAISVPSDHDYFTDALRRWRWILKDFKAEQIVVDLTGARISSSNTSMWEVDIQLNQTWGVPCIFGHSIKSRFASWIKQRKNKLFDNDKDWDLFQAAIFGSASKAGSIVFHDAWWIGSSSEISNDTPSPQKPFMQSTTTVHHQDYYKKYGKVAPTLFDEPTPIAFPAVNGSMLFAIEIPKEQNRLCSNIAKIFDIFLIDVYGNPP